MSSYAVCKHTAEFCKLTLHELKSLVSPDAIELVILYRLYYSYVHQVFVFKHATVILLLHAISSPKKKNAGELVL